MGDSESVSFVRFLLDRLYMGFFLGVFGGNECFGGRDECVLLVWFLNRHNHFFCAS